jgi:hypothetical protein
MKPSTKFSICREVTKEISHQGTEGTQKKFFCVPFVPSVANFLLNVLPDFLILGETSGLQLRENLFSADADFETSAIGRNQYKACDTGLEFFDEFFGQTDRFWFVVSSLAVDDFDFHYFPCGAASLMPSQAFFN